MEAFEAYLKRHYQIYASDEPIRAQMHEALEYSLFSGGKRFRPKLSLQAAKALGLSDERVFPWAAAIESIHTYSLIHDDLPCMDDDDVRRGRPSSHKKYGEATALLIGDAFLTEAFALLARSYGDEGPLLGKLILNLTQASGLDGMILGQKMDLEVQTSQDMNLDQMESVHLYKTGRLISASLTGPAILAGVDPSQARIWSQLGLQLGLAFQYRDDLLDLEQDHSGLEISAIESRLAMATGECRKCLKDISGPTEGLSELVDFNFQRAR